MNAIVQNLQNIENIKALASRLSDVKSYYHSPERASDIPETIKNFLRLNPELRDIKILATPKVRGGAYFPGKDTIAIGAINPAVLAHELAHAENLRRAPIYRKMLNIASDVARINNIAAVPAMLTLRTFVGDPNTRREIFNILSGASAAVTAPLLVEELGASLTAVQHAPNKLHAIKTLLPAFLHHTAEKLMPAGVYQVGKMI